MKKKLLCFLTTLFVLTSGFAFASCTGEETPPRDYNADVQVVPPENVDSEHFVPEEDKTYYTSPGFSLWMEVNGAFLEMDYFYLDGSKRVYDNLPFYKEDYFYIVTDDLKDLYAGLGDSADTEYAEEEKQQGEEVQINIKKTGYYKVIFDTETLKFDLEYKAEITTPVYYTIPNCEIYSVATSWVPMSVNPDNEDEFFIQNFYVEAGKDIHFFNRVHTSHYKVTLDDACADKYASVRKTAVTINVGGSYNVYINKKTYVVRLELQNDPPPSYSLVYYDGADFITLSPYDEDVPDLFRYQLSVDASYTRVPDFHTKNYRTYRLAVEDSNLLSKTSKYAYFKTAGEYELTINLQTFTISVALLPQ